MKQPATITLNDAAIAQIAEALAPHIERLLDERLARKETSVTGGPRLLRWRDVSKLTGMSRSSIYRDPDFPKPIKLGDRMVAWREQDIRDWINGKATSQ